MWTAKFQAADALILNKQLKKTKSMMNHMMKPLLVVIAHVALPTWKMNRLLHSLYKRTHGGITFIAVVRLLMKARKKYGKTNGGDL